MVLVYVYLVQILDTSRDTQHTYRHVLSSITITITNALITLRNIMWIPLIFKLLVYNMYIMCFISLCRLARFIHTFIHVFCRWSLWSWMNCHLPHNSLAQALKGSKDFADNNHVAPSKRSVNSGQIACTSTWSESMSAWCTIFNHSWYQEMGPCTAETDHPHHSICSIGPSPILIPSSEISPL